jgi:hypothetical protein
MNPQLNQCLISRSVKLLSARLYWFRSALLISLGRRSIGRARMLIHMNMNVDVSAGGDFFHLPYETAKTRGEQYS